MSKADILIVEDDLIQAERLRFAVENQGYRVLDIVPSGEEAIRKSETLRPDLILMDIQLAGEMDGVDAAEKIQSQFDLPVIYLPAYYDQTTFERAKGTGPQNYLLKTAGNLDLHLAIEMALYRKKLEQALKGRIKELDCLYHFSELAGRLDLSLEDFLQGTVDLLSSGCRYSAAACARIKVEDREYRSGGFRETAWRQAGDIEVHGQKLGTIEIYCQQEKSQRVEGPFLKEERFLINMIRERLGRRIERQKLQEKLEHHQAHLEDLIEKRTFDLRKTQAMLESVFEGISEPLMLVDRDLRVKIKNKVSTEYFGGGIDLEKELPCLKGAADQPETCMTCPIPDAVLKNEFISFQRKGFMDQERIEQVFVYPVKKDGKNTDEAIIRIRDITEEIRLNEEMVKAQKLISLGTLVAGVAHEINNPNNYIMLNAPILMEVWKSVLPILEEVYQSKGEFSLAGLPFSEMKLDVPGLISGIEEGARRITRIVKELKEYSTLDLLRQPRPEEINSVVRRAVSLLAHNIKKSTQNFSVVYGENLPPVKGDFQKLEQVIVNLIQNALEALPEKSKGVSLRTFSGQEKQKVKIEIRDEGAGITDKDLSRIMDPFFTTKRTSGGVGLGLSVSGNIIRQHGGTIDTESESGKGTVILVTLPAAVMTETKRILLVDDDPLIRTMIKDALGTDSRYVVTEASNGVEACISLGKDLPDLLILDLLMPDMNGKEVCRIIKRDPFLSKIKVMIITGYPESPLIKEIKTMGFKEVLPKPFRLKDLLARVEQVLGIPL
jgi:signal transduction histidine kinase/DNA-binding NarL/FixJ family response regulator